MKILRHFLGLFRSHGGANQVALGFCLGIFCGLIPCQGIYPVLWALLLIVFRLSLPAFLLAVAAFKPISYAVGPSAYRIGCYLLEKPELGGERLWSPVCELPGIALLELNRYLILGSWVLSVLFSLVFYFVVRALWLHLFWSKPAGKEKEVSKDAVPSDSGKEKVGRTSRWFFGDQPFKGNPFFRGRLLLYLSLLLLAVFLGFTSLSEIILKKAMEKWVSRATGADVRIEGANWSWLHGKLSLHSVEVTDPTARERTIFSAELIELDMAISSLMDGQAVFDAIGIRDASLRLDRDEKGEFNFKALKFLQRDAGYLEDARKIAKSESGLSERQWLILEVKNPDWLGALFQWGLERKLISSYKNFRKLEIIGKYTSLMAETQQKTDVMNALLRVPTIKELEELKTLTPQEILLLKAKASYIGRRPPLACRRFYGENFKIVMASSETEQTINCDFEASDFALYAEPLEIVQYRSPICGKFSCQKVPLKELAPLYKRSLPLAFEKGALNFALSFEYTMEKKSENVAVDTGQKKFFGSAEIALDDIKAVPTGALLGREDTNAIKTTVLIEGLNELRTLKIPLQIKEGKTEVPSEARDRLIQEAIIQKSTAALLNLFGGEEEEK